ncbi:MAG TPA: triose-phosphate isomerase, partial [bacterium]|nr:triose-phosphate isomerase [bacterium]
MARTPIIAGNWKMYKTPQESVDFARQLAGKLKDVQGREVLVCPTFLSAAAVVDALRFSGIQVGAQDAHWEDEGAYTGNVSPAMLKAAGLAYAILGHSERRQYDNDTDDRVNRKLKNVLKNGLRAILCVGETLQEREAGRTEAVIEGQLKGGLADISLADL